MVYLVVFDHDVDPTHRVVSVFDTREAADAEAHRLIWTPGVGGDFTVVEMVLNAPYASSEKDVGVR